jgi:hypothetical protein
VIVAAVLSPLIVATLESGETRPASIPTAIGMTTRDWGHRRNFVIFRSPITPDPHPVHAVEARMTSWHREDQ